MATDDTRDRVIRLEAIVEALVFQNKETNQIVKDLRDIVVQGRTAANLLQYGARAFKFFIWGFVMFLGYILSKIPAIATILYRP